MLKSMKIGICALAVCAASLGATAASANVLTMLLVRSSLDNDTDPSSSGLWQYEGGVVQNSAGTSNIGHYIITRRVTTSGTSADNAAAMTITLFFSNATAGNVANNMTVQGAWSFTSGQFAGSVSAASARYHPLISQDATATVATNVTKLLINYTGTYVVP